MTFRFLQQPAIASPKSYGSPWNRPHCTPHPLLRSTVLPLRHGEGGAGEGAAAAALRPRDGQHPRRGPGALEAQVCLLDPRAARRGQGGGQGPLGRADGPPGAGFVGGFTVDPEGVEVGSAEYVRQWLHGTPLYDRVHDEDVLGEEMGEGEDSPGGQVQRCFNCGEPGHVVSECAQPVDRRLVALSRQYFEFFRKGPAIPRLRVHEVEEWRRQRLDWLDAFDPGQIRGSLLREALGLRDGDAGERVEWLANIANWGYPPGWVGSCDPRERVWQRISDTCPPGEDEAEEDPLYIFTDGDPEVCELSGHAAVDSRSETPSVSDEDDDASASSADPPSRWATYPDTYFLWSKLPICTGWVLPALGAESPPPQASVSRTYTADREALWQTIITSSSHQPRAVPLPPWRTHGGFCGVSSLTDAAPPPPISTPPPPPPSTPPPLPLRLPLPSLSLLYVRNDSNMEIESDDDDMDLSD